MSIVIFNMIVHIIVIKNINSIFRIDYKLILIISNLFLHLSMPAKCQSDYKMGRNVI